MLKLNCRICHNMLITCSGKYGEYKNCSGCGNNESKRNYNKRLRKLNIQLLQDKLSKEKEEQQRSNQEFKETILKNLYE